MDDKPLPVGLATVLRLFFGGLIAIPGWLLIGSGLGVVHIFPWAANGPFLGRLALILSGLPFASFGAMIVLHPFIGEFGEEKTPIAEGIKHVLLLSFLIPIAFTLLWGGFGPGERKFTTITTVGSEVTTGSGNELVGRILFGGLGVLITILILLYIHTQFIRKNSR
jgi:hypothetical protein